MQTYRMEAELADDRGPIPSNQEAYPIDPHRYDPAGRDMYVDEPPANPQSSLFAQPNDLRVIQEYNQEENMPNDTKKSFWALASKSIKLGFWRESDLNDIYLHKNIIKVGHIMANPRHKYSFTDRQLMNQMDMMVYSDFKRGVGMERYKINERTLQATSVTQSIQGGGQAGRKRSGIVAGLKNFFG